MTPKQRDRKFRRDTSVRDKAKRGKPSGAPRTPKTEAYNRDQRVNLRASLRSTDWGWF